MGSAYTQPRRTLQQVSKYRQQLHPELRNDGGILRADSRGVGLLHVQSGALRQSLGNTDMLTKADRECDTTIPALCGGGTARPTMSSRIEYLLW